ncbi:hypothetical protein LSCM4_00475 [Leishmania orientalis]|uniref:Casein kinase substrate phosphoprotein PP28 domain-containing protein n=1 Tax=Leishmania orientalis TaxID=2249476 RepID=A0A836G461_9TRYP|nr:hypothetical protein LSCM4_00475 [Leishmania orientalis]
MRRVGSRAWAPTAVAAGSALVAQVLASPSSAPSPSLCSCSHVLAQCRLHTGCFVACTRIVFFDLRKHEMEKRRLRELEKAGIDPGDEDDAPWIAPEEQQRLDEEEEERRAKLEEQRQALMKKRAEEDAVKRQKFKEFRARQISMSRQRKEAVTEKKEEARQHRKQTSRIEGVDTAEESTGADRGGAESKDASDRGAQ